jgi:hypothetical protein
LCFPVASSSANIRISDSGVFSSCETLAMKSLLSCDARRSARTVNQTTPRPTAMITVDTGISSTPSRRSVLACARSSSTLVGVICTRHAYSVLPNAASYRKGVDRCGAAPTTGRATSSRITMRRLLASPSICSGSHSLAMVTRFSLAAT